jgi:hypothetical protein
MYAIGIDLNIHFINEVLAVGFNGINWPALVQAACSDVCGVL